MDIGSIYKRWPRLECHTARVQHHPSIHLTIETMENINIIYLNLTWSHDCYNVQTIYFTIHQFHNSQTHAALVLYGSPLRWLVHVVECTSARLCYSPLMQFSISVLCFFAFTHILCLQYNMHTVSQNTYLHTHNLVEWWNVEVGTIVYDFASLLDCYCCYDDHDDDDDGALLPCSE